MAVTEGYVQYDVKLPNRGLLIAAITAGWLVIASGVGILIWTFVTFVKGTGSMFSYEPRYSPEQCQRYNLDPDVYPECRSVGSIPLISAEWLYDHWYVALVPLVLGAIVLILVHGTYYHFFKEVQQGVVCKRDTTGGGDYSLEWTVLVQGNTRANELTTEWKTVDAGYWDDVKVGDWYDARE